MKQFKTIFISAIITLVAFGAITYTSCTKDPCAGVTCLNGGACSGGNCSCPTGYTGADCGQLVTTNITYKNDTYTPIVITAGGTTSTIPVGGNVTYSGSYGDALTASAYTSGTTTSGTQVGDLITYDQGSISANFPANGTTVIDLDVSSDYFYLYVQNTSANYTVTTINVNSGTAAATTDYLTIPYDTNTYGIGYYLAYTNTSIILNGSGSGGATNSETRTPFLSSSFASNQSYSFNFN